MACFVVMLPLLLALVKAQVPHWGPCTEPATQPAFNLKQFMGRWFEIAKLPARFEKGRCIESNFTLKVDGTAQVVRTVIAEEPKNPAKLGIIFSHVLPYATYWILSTDYVNSALVYSCIDVLRLFHVDFAWILSRTRSLPASAITQAREVFTSNNIDVSHMVLSSHMCSLSRFTC
uniref:Apolipoprotein D n=1 Tax=Electrophorus electricus TaxID=8005 RepID=A0A4W4EME1_ELEEL